MKLSGRVGSTLAGAIIVGSVIVLAGLPSGSAHGALFAEANPAPPLRPVHLRSRILGDRNLVRVWAIRYKASDGVDRAAYVVLPRWYGPHDNPPIPFVISPHGRNVEPQKNARFWGNLPAFGSFGVVNPEGQGRDDVSWGAAGQISDLSRMPQIVMRALPWIRIELHRIYAVGTSMGGQETLLLLAQHPHLLAGAAALDAPTDLAARYEAFRRLPHGPDLQRLARIEFGGGPRKHHDAYVDRSPLFHAREIANSGVPLQIWWSSRDRVVRDQAAQSGLLYRAIKRINPYAPVRQVIGTWAHSMEMRARNQLPIVLAPLGLIRLAHGASREARGHARRQAV